MANEDWLVRTTKNKIIGPVTREGLAELIQSGELGIEDEVCRANHYWFYLHEKEEVQLQLGAEFSAYVKELGAPKSTTEITDEMDGRNEEKEEPTDPFLHSPLEADSSLNRSQTENTAVLSMGEIQEIRAPKQGAGDESPAPRKSQSREPQSFETRPRESTPRPQRRRRSKKREDVPRKVFWAVMVFLAVILLLTWFRAILQ